MKERGSNRPPPRKNVPSKKPSIIKVNEDDSALKVAYQITFRGLVTYKPAAYKKIEVYTFYNSILTVLILMF